MSEGFNYFSTLLISASISLIFFTVISIYFLSGGVRDNSFIQLNVPIMGSALIGVVLGIIHGLITGLFLIWRRSDTTFSTLIASVLAMEIISLIIYLCIWLLDRSHNSNSQTLEKLSFIDYLITDVEIFLRISLYLLIPALLIGFANRLFFFFYR